MTPLISRPLLEVAVCVSTAGALTITVAPLTAMIVRLSWVWPLTMTCSV